MGHQNNFFSSFHLNFHLKNSLEATNIFKADEKYDLFRILSIWWNWCSEFFPGSSKKCRLFRKLFFILPVDIVNSVLLLCIYKNRKYVTNLDDLFQNIDIFRTFLHVVLYWNTKYGWKNARIFLESIPTYLEYLAYNVLYRAR